ncbi:MAG: tetratricopeptide repeat protein [Planctomycetota bacterium]
MSDLNEAWDLLQANDFTGARAIFEEAIAQEPDNTEALFGLARTWDCNSDFDRYLHLTDLDKAREIYETLIAEDEGDLESLYYLCRILMKEGQNEEALRRVEEGLRIDPQNPDLLSIKGMLLFDKSDLEGSESAHLAALRSAGAAHYLNEIALIAMARDNFDRAEEILRLSLDIEPNACWAHRNLAQLLADRGEWSGAMEAAKRYYETGGMEVDLEESIKEWEKNLAKEKGE